jgi:hypothetical protein
METFKFNKVVSTLMKFHKDNKKTTISKKSAQEITEIMRCFAPGFGYAEE